MPIEPETAVAAPAGAPRKRAEKPPRIAVRVSWCKGCGLCVVFCNRGVLEMKDALPEVRRVERCTRCMQCEAMCPDFAISVKEEA